MDPPLLTSLDESFGHQLVAPRAVTEHDDQRWAERAYFLLHVNEGLTINAGRQLYRHAGHWTVFAAAATPEREACLRTMPEFARGDDPDAPAVGPLRLAVEAPSAACAWSSTSPVSRSPTTSPSRPASRRSPTTRP